MTWQRKTGGRDFKPGQSGNPNGRPRLPEDVKEARRLNQVELERVINKYLFMSTRRLEFKFANKSTRALDRMVIGLILKGSAGNIPSVTLITERLVGKVKTVVEVSRPESKRPIEEQLGEMTDEEVDAHYAKLKEKAKSEP